MWHGFQVTHSKSNPAEPCLNEFGLDQFGIFLFRCKILINQFQANPCVNIVYVCVNIRSIRMPQACPMMHSILTILNCSTFNYEYFHVYISSSIKTTIFTATKEILTT